MTVAESAAASWDPRPQDGMVGESLTLYECPACAAMVRWYSIEDHKRWHAHRDGEVSPATKEHNAEPQA